MEKLSIDKRANKPEILEEHETRYKQLVDSIKDYAIFMLDPHGYIMTWNSGAEKLKGYTRSEIINKHFSIFYPKEVSEKEFPEYELKMASKNGTFEDEGWRIRKDGTKFWANVVISAIYSKKKQLLGFSKVTRDLTERVRNEELMKKNKELHQINTDLDNFIYTASHDLKSPIANLEGLVSLLQRKVAPKLNESDLQIINMMEASITKLNNTIISLADVIKAQRNLEDMEEEVSLQEIVDDVKEELANFIKDSGAEIKENLMIKQLTFARANLRSIIYNLLSNAIKYRSPKRQPVIDIHTYREGRSIVLTVKDNGLGLSENQQAKLFSMFKRFHNHVEGTGIGLYIIKRIVENKGGTIKVQSKLDDGTEFKLYFSSNA